MTIEYVIVVLLGMAIGSFLNVCIYRLPRDMSVVLPPSHCPGCGKRLGVPDLFPVFSYIFLKGRCRYCGMRISPRYPLIELLTGFVYAALFYRFGASIDFVAAIYLISVLIAVFFIDGEHKIIPNELVVAGLAAGAAVIIFSLFTGRGLFGNESWMGHLAGILPGTVVMLLAAVLGSIIFKSEDAMGMGDVKIFAPIGILLGWKLCFLVLFLAVISAGLTSVFLLILHIRKRTDTIPFGPFIVISSFVAMMWGTEILQWYLG